MIMLRGMLYLQYCVFEGCGWNDYLYGGHSRLAPVIRDASLLEFLIEIRIGLSKDLIRVPFLGMWNFCNHKGSSWQFKSFLD